MIRKGFTLVELLLVLTLIGIITAVAIPNLARSAKGSRLRIASRTIVMAGKYARSMAVMKQVPMALIFNMSDGIISVKPTTAAAVEQNTVLSGENAGDKEEDGEERARAEEEERVNAIGEYDDTLPSERPSVSNEENDVSIVRSLDKISIASVIKGGSEAGLSSGSVSIVYESNGRCTPYEVVLKDDDGLSVTIIVDALASAETFPGGA